MHLQERHYLTFDLDLGFKSYEVLLSTLNIMLSIHLQRLKVLCRRVKEMYLQENILFDLELRVKITGNVAQYSLHHVTYAPVKF